MLVLMALDHLYLYLFPSGLLPAHYLARVVAPVFTFLLSESMVYTRNRERYISRLFVCGIVMSAGNAVLTLAMHIKITNNIFLPLAVGAALIYCIDKAKAGNDTTVWLSLAVLLSCSVFLLKLEGVYLVPMMALIFYYLRQNRPLMYICYIFLSGLPYAAAYFATGSLQAQFYMIFAVFPIMLYNGRRGHASAVSKYFFYIFYPIHIWLIVAAKYIFFTT